MFINKNILQNMRNFDLKNNFKSVLAGSLIFTLLLGSGYSIVEPILVGAVTDSVTVTLTVNSEITISDAGNVTMTPNISLSNDTAATSTSWTVATSDTNGYALSVQASTDPAMQSGSDSFADYSEGTPETPEQWSVSNAYEFGFSAYGTHVPTGTWGTDQSSCGSGGPLVSATRLYRGFNGTSPIQIASHSATTSTSGVSSTVCFGAEQDTALAPSGTYTATITATALVQ